MNPPLAIVILNWNNWKKTMACLNSLNQQSHRNYHVLLIDNGSSNDSASQLKEFCQDNDQITMIFNPENRGFMGGCNQGYAKVKEILKDFRHILFLNNDATVNESTITELHQLIENSNAPLVCAKGVNAKTEKVYFHGFRLPQFLFGIYRDYPMNEKLQAWPTDYCEGSALLVAREFIEQLIEERGFFMDESLFMYCDDVDLGFVCKQKGLNIYVSSKAIIHHSVSDSSGGGGSPLAYYYITRNRVALANQYLPLWQRWGFHLYYLSSRIPLMVKNLLQGRGAIVSATWQGLVDGYLGRAGKWRRHSL